MRKAVYAGSFDPLTIGHLDIIKRSLEVFDHVVILVADNPNKKTLFSADERMVMIYEVLHENPRLSFDTYQGLTVDYCEKNGIKFLVRGLRAVQDYESELTMAYANNFLNNGIETVYFMASAEHSFISSSAVREIAAFSDRYKELVPANVARKYEEKLRRR